MSLCVFDIACISNFDFSRAHSTICSSATVASDLFLAPLVALREWPASAILVLGVSALLKARNRCIRLLNQNLLNQDLIWPRFSVFFVRPVN